MRISKALLKGSKIRNKVTNLMYIITSNEDGVVQAHLEGSSEPEETVTITDDNSICYRVETWASDKEVPVAAVDEDGILIVNGEKINQGELKVAAILGTIKGYVALILHDGTLATYEVARDYFYVSGEKAPADMRLAFEDNNKDVLIFTFKSAKKTKKDDKEEIVFDKGGVVYVADGRIYKSFFPEPLADQILRLEDTYTFYLKSNYDKELNPKEPTWYEVAGDFLKTDVGNANPVYTGELFFATMIRNLKMDKPLIVGERGFSLGREIIPYKGSLAETPYLVDITEQNDITKYSFADYDCNKVTKIAVKRTKDRGFILM